MERFALWLDILRQEPDILASSGSTIHQPSSLSTTTAATTIAAAAAASAATAAAAAVAAAAAAAIQKNITHSNIRSNHGHLWTTLIPPSPPTYFPHTTIPTPSTRRTTSKTTTSTTPYPYPFRRFNDPHSTPSTTSTHWQNKWREPSTHSPSTSTLTSTTSTTPMPSFTSTSTTSTTTRSYPSTSTGTPENFFKEFPSSSELPSQSYDSSLALFLFDIKSYLFSALEIHRTLVNFAYLEA